MRTICLSIVFLIFVSMSVSAQPSSVNCAQSSDTVVSEDLPVVTPYYLQHQYLSVLAPEVKVTDGFIFQSPEILNTISANYNGFKSPFEDDDINVDSVRTDGKVVYVWRFPEPEYLREALYIAFFPVDGFYMAYAISKGQLVDWEISTSTESMRHTFGRVKRPESAQECVELLKARGAMKGEIKGGGFYQKGYSCPPPRE